MDIIRRIIKKINYKNNQRANTRRRPPSYPDFNCCVGIVAGLRELFLRRDVSDKPETSARTGVEFSARTDADTTFDQAIHLEPYHAHIHGLDGYGNKYVFTRSSGYGGV